MKYRFIYLYFLKYQFNIYIYIIFKEKKTLNSYQDKD